MPDFQVSIKKRYRYSPLYSDQVRILHLQPGEPNDTVFVEISPEKLDGDIIKYSALSWEWGSERAREAIRIKDKGNTDSEIRMMPIKPNLLAALKRLRQRHKIERLWVDAICIDQTELDDNVDTVKQRNLEKSNQISMMTKIYGMAEKVCVWLGEESEDSAKAVQFIDRLVKLEDMYYIAGLERSSNFDYSIANDLGSLIKLLKRGWFNRRWVVQEIALARDAIVHCGGESVSWTKLADAVALLEKVGRDGTINKILKRLPATNHVPEYIGNFSSMPAYRLVQNTTGLFRRQDELGFRTWRYTLEELVSFLAAFKASRLHDTIYAILGLASDFEPVDALKFESKVNDTEPKPVDALKSESKVNDTEPKLVDALKSESKVNATEPKPNLRRANTRMDWARTMEPFKVDYEKSPLAVFKEFLDGAIKKSQSLDIICRPWAPTSGFDAKGNHQNVDLPSWIPSLSRKPFQLTRDGNMVRYNPDPLVGPALFRHKYYSASGLCKVYCNIDLKSPDSKHMTVKGFILDKIGETWDSGEFGNVPGDWLRAGHWKDEDKVPPDELWRTLVADRNAQGDDPDRWYPLVFQSAVKERGISYGFETYRLIHEGTNAPVAELFRRVQAVVWNRRLIRTQGQYMEWLTKEPRNCLGALGLAPNNARKDDLICIIFGCSVPLVLRQAHRPKQSESPQLHASTTSAKPQGASTSSKDNSEDGEKLYTLVGECYIDHMMDGEAIAYFKDQDICPQEFKLE